jgi:hypothetical protein
MIGLERAELAAARRLVALLRSSDPVTRELTIQALAHLESLSRSGGSRDRSALSLAAERRPPAYPGPAGSTTALIDPRERGSRQSAP